MGSHSPEKTHFRRLYPWSRSFSPSLMTLGEGRNKDSSVGRELYLLAQLPFHHNGATAQTSPDDLMLWPISYSILPSLVNKTLRSFNSFGVRTHSLPGVSSPPVSCSEPNRSDQFVCSLIYSHVLVSVCVCFIWHNTYCFICSSQRCPAEVRCSLWSVGPTTLRTTWLLFHGELWNTSQPGCCTGMCCEFQVAKFSPALWKAW